MRGDGGVTGEGRVVGIPKFHSGIFFRQEYSNASTGTHKNGCLNTKLAD